MNARNEESVEDVIKRLDQESKRKKLAKEKTQPDSSKETEAKQKSFLEDDAYIQSFRDEKSLHLFPERSGQPYTSSWSDIIWKGEGREHIDRFKCEQNVRKVIGKSHLVRLMMGALKSAGCEIDLRRHITCEVCDKSVTGGFDPYLNQIVVCQNTARYKGLIQGVLTHEMIHMFDFCKHNLDFKNLKHLACTEIRAANLAHCSFLSAWVSDKASFFNVSDTHKECVRSRAVDSVLAVRDVSRKEAEEAVDSVFQKCYNDLEPIGRRIRRNSDHIQKAYYERKFYGYE